MVGPITVAEVEVGLGDVGILLCNPTRAYVGWGFSQNNKGGGSVTRRKGGSGAGLETTMPRVIVLWPYSTQRGLRGFQGFM